MKTIFGAFVMTLGVLLITWNLYCIYHHMPLAPFAFFAGLICAFLGANWVSGEKSRPI